MVTIPQLSCHCPVSRLLRHAEGPVWKFFLFHTLEYMKKMDVSNSSILCLCVIVESLLHCNLRRMWVWEQEGRTIKHWNAVECLSTFNLLIALEHCFPHPLFCYLLISSLLLNVKHKVWCSLAQLKEGVNFEMVMSAIIYFCIC